MKLSFFKAAIFSQIILCTANADIIDDSANAIVSGVVEKLPAKTIEACNRAVKKGGVRDVAKLELHEAYVSVVKLALIDPDRHGGWPYRFEGLSKAKPARDLFNSTSAKFKKSPTPLNAFIAFHPAIAAGKITEAQKLLKHLKKAKVLKNYLDQQLSSNNLAKDEYENYIKLRANQYRRM